MSKNDYEYTLLKKNQANANSFALALFVNRIIHDMNKGVIDDQSEAIGIRLE